jgi:outer membrane protein OmpA-like peptidoglycan-associated protein
MFLINPRLFFIVIFFCFFSFSVRSQNLFFNADFEELNLCTELNQLCSNAAWFYIKPALTPQLRYNPKPFSGKELLTVPIENIYSKNIKRSFVYTMLGCPLQKGKKYKISFLLNTGGKKFYGLDFYFRKKEFLSNNFLEDTVVANIHFEDSTIRDKHGWSFYETIYTANGDERFCLIGNLSKTKFDFAGEYRMNKAGDMYYFIDDVNLTALSPEPLCNNYYRNKTQSYNQHLRHSERTILEEEPALPEFIKDTISIPSVFFETDKAILKPAFKKRIDELIIKFKNKEISKIDIEGHTDNTGTEIHNRELSIERAEAVLNYFVKKIPQLKDNIFAFGKASTNPISDNNTIEGRAKNRRVQIVFTYSLKE